MRDYDKKVIQLLKQLEDVSFDNSRNTLTFPFDVNQDIIKLLENEQIEADRVGANLVEIEIANLPWYVFIDENDFLARANRHCWSKPVLILTENILYICERDITFINFLESNKYLLISNNYYCYQFLNFLKSQDHRESSAFYFVDYFNWDSRHVVLTSLKKDGKIEFNLPSTGINVREDVGLKKAYEEFKTAFEDQNKHYPKFLKAELIGTISKVEKSKRMEELLRRLNEIVYVSSQNFEIYLHDLSLENLKKDFIEYKNKYFIQLREVLSKLTNQILGLPLAIAASVFSTYKVTDSLSTLLIILTVFLIYTLYSVYLLKIQKEDIIDMELNFEMDYKRLSESQFFKKFDNELEDFNRVKCKLTSRIKSLLSAIDLYFFFFAVSSTLFLVYLLLQIKLEMWGIVIAAILLSGGFLAIYILNQTLRRD